MLATCTTTTQLWNNPNHSLIDEFGQDHHPKTDTIKSLHWKSDHCTTQSFGFSVSVQMIFYLYTNHLKLQRYYRIDLTKPNFSFHFISTKAQCCSFTASGKY
jgi:hypothetical protein